MLALGSDTLVLCSLPRPPSDSACSSQQISLLSPRSSQLFPPGLSCASLQSGCPSSAFCWACPPREGSSQNSSVERCFQNGSPKTSSSTKSSSNPSSQEWLNSHCFYNQQNTAKHSDVGFITQAKHSSAPINSLSKLSLRLYYACRGFWSRHPNIPQWAVCLHGD